MVLVWKQRLKPLNLDTQKSGNDTLKNNEGLDIKHFQTIEWLYYILKNVFSKLQASGVSSSTPELCDLLLHEWVMVVLCLIISIHFASSWDCKCLLFALFPRHLVFYFFSPCFHFKGRDLRKGATLRGKNQFPKKQ